MQHEIAPEKLSRVSAYSWMCAMVFLPLGYALAGPIADAVGMSAYLVFGAVWIVVTTLIVFSVPAVRNYRLPGSRDRRLVGGDVVAHHALRRELLLDVAS